MQHARSTPLGPGTFVAIGGPSGVGKDSLIRYAHERLADDPCFLFVRRTITRPPETTEDHLSVDAAEFERQNAAGAFALTWSAHGLHYGLPQEIDAAIANGRVVIANISRAVLPDVQKRYANVLAIAVAADRSTVLGRLAARGRESAEQIAGRANRVVAGPSDDWIELRNDGELREAGDRLVRLLADHASVDRH